MIRILRVRRASVATCGLALVALLLAPAVPRAAGTLDIYWIDVEGGAATLIISPTGEALLYDAGWEIDGRDAKRIAAAAKAAGLKKIDYFVLSHYHPDHAGGLATLPTMIPIGRCFDRGDFIETENQHWRDLYLAACGDRRTILKAGDRIPLKGVQVDVIASNGRLIAHLLKGDGPNPLCAAAENHPRDVPENQLMVSALFTYGRFRFLDTADLDWEKEMELACPINRLGEVTIWQAGRHGALDGAGAPGFLNTIKPQIVIVNNGPHKGLGAPSPGFERARTNHYARVMAIPGIEDVWQGHRSLFEGSGNAPDERIANLDDTNRCQGHWLKATVRPDGAFSIVNGRTGFTKTYTAR
jgi:competence protein ComEC